MKSANQIIQHMVEAPQFKRLKRMMLIEKFIDFLPPSIRQAILFNYEKDETLFFALNHPAFLKEFNYKTPLIKSLLIKAQESVLSELSNIKDVKAFVSRTAIVKYSDEDDKDECYRYKEHSDGEFENLASDEDIAAYFERIRQIIKKNISLNELGEVEGFYRRQIL